MLELKFVERKEADRDNCHYELSIYTIGCYEVWEVQRTCENGDSVRDITVFRPHATEGMEYYLPDIYLDNGVSYLPYVYFDEGVFCDKEPQFKIQTASHRALESEEYDLFLEAAVMAKEVADVLTKELLNK